MSTRTVTIARHMLPGGEQGAPAAVLFEFTDATGLPLVGHRRDDGQGIVGALTVSVGAEAVTVDLTPTTEITPAGYWRTRVQLSGRTVESYLVRIGAGAELTFPEFISLDESSGWWDVNENRLLPDPAGAADGAIPTVVSGEWSVGDAPAGTGTVTSVAVSGSDGIEVDSGSPITAAGTVALGIDAAALRTHINVEDGATADQTGAEIEALLDAELGGTDWKTGGSSGSGDMAAETYDPQSIQGDAFARANHTGTQAIATITGLQTALDGKSSTSHDHTGVYEPAGAVSTHETTHNHLEVVAFPAAANSSGSVGQIAFSSNHIAICLATDTWYFFPASASRPAI